MKKAVLEAEEKDILESYERGEWKPVKNQKEEIRKLQGYARNTLQKDKRINIRMSSKDLDHVQVIAAQEGIPYQTLISSIIHKYVSGYLTEKKGLNYCRHQGQPQGLPLHWDKLSGLLNLSVSSNT